ncbi:hypothetical protein [Mucilaginibacter psychrotolerans]|uniref:Uncharacterized protein n=1 Tax=Mucilaginibacter psychrotolerans TaxID=1524096 RepID=A0A4Y8SN13_9SPHI|nr:hypothetical protein [Mucilaginibacter psychrotolerans]TFF39746.1 hypothetical protein E2R66_05105 [Mucilaginibacter psychrotolerans]
MKKQLLAGIIALSTIALVYTSCKKTSTDPSTKTVDAKTVTQEIALNIAQTFYGDLGGFDFSDGLHPQVNAVRPGFKKIVINTVNPECGLKVDTTLSYNIGIDTTQLSISGRFKYATTCINNNISGLTFYDSLLVSMITPSLAVKYRIGQDLAVTSLGPGNPNSELSFGGTMNMQVDLEVKTGTKAKANTVFNYKLTSLIVDPADDGQIKGGSAVFKTTGSTPQGKWDYTGTILFMGDNKVKITINGATYTVDIQTGQIV